MDNFIQITCILSTQASSLCHRYVGTVYFTVLPVKFNTVKPLLSPLGSLFISSSFEEGGGVIETGGLILENTMVSVLHKELEYKVEKLKYKKVGGTSTW